MNSGDSSPIPGRNRPETILQALGAVGVVLGLLVLATSRSFTNGLVLTVGGAVLLGAPRIWRSGLFGRFEGTSVYRLYGWLISIAAALGAVALTVIGSLRLIENDGTPVWRKLFYYVAAFFTLRVSVLVRRKLKDEVGL